MLVVDVVVVVVVVVGAAMNEMNLLVESRDIYIDIVVVVVSQNPQILSLLFSLGPFSQEVSSSYTRANYIYIYSLRLNICCLNVVEVVELVLAADFLPFLFVLKLE